MTGVSMLTYTCLRVLFSGLLQSLLAPLHLHPEQVGGNDLLGC